MPNGFTAGRPYARAGSTPGRNNWPQSAMLAVLFAVLVTVTGPVSAQDSISKLVLIKLTRDQSTVLCESDVFTQCMEFSKERCLALAEAAIENCLGPLPDTIDTRSLSNDTLESCPIDIYENAGFTEDRAQTCVDQAMEAG